MQPQNNSPKKLRAIFRQRSLSSLPSRHMSVMNIINERESIIQKESIKNYEEKSAVLVKQFQITKLRKNLQSVMSSAIHQKLENSKTKEEINSFTYQKNYLEGKIKQLEKDLKSQKEKCAALVFAKEDDDHKIDQITANCKELEANCQAKNVELVKLKGSLHEVQKYKLMLKDLEPLRNRIVLLEQSLREEKVGRKNIQQKLREREKERDELAKQLSTTKPKQQELRERIAYFERVNLDLQRKMQDYNRRENDYIKQITSLKANLTKVTADRNHFKTVYQQTLQKLKQKSKEYDQLTEEMVQKMAIIKRLQEQFQEQKKVAIALRGELEEKVLYYKKQGEQNIYLKQRNKLLQNNQYEIRRVVEGYVRISDQVNITIVSRTQEIRKLKIIIQTYQTQLKECQEKYQKFDHLLQQGSQKGFNQIREGFYHFVRSNNDLSTQLKQVKASMDQKFLIFGEERDALYREKEIRSMPFPTDQNQYESIFYQKTEAIVLLQKSNDQLLKIKKDLESQIEGLLEDIQKGKKQMTMLKLKTADIIKAKKDLEEARKTMQRYQQMIQEQKQIISDVQSQVTALRQKNTELNDKNFVIQLDKRNLELKIKEINQVLKELNHEVLEAHKQLNDKNTHFLSDALQKLDSAIKSLNFYFHCAFCGELPTTPVTLALCGHNYCTKCKEAYSQSCYECDTGQPIQKVFQNKFLKDAAGKFKFLVMVVSELKANFATKEKQGQKQHKNIRPKHDSHSRHESNSHSRIQKARKH